MNLHTKFTIKTLTLAHLLGFEYSSTKAKEYWVIEKGRPICLVSMSRILDNFSVHTQHISTKTNIHVIWVTEKNKAITCLRLWHTHTLTHTQWVVISICDLFQIFEAKKKQTRPVVYLLSFDLRSTNLIYFEWLFKLEF